MSKFNVGEIVKVKNPGNVYCTYKDKFVQFSFNNKIHNSPFLKRDELVKITHIGYHDQQYINLYGCVTLNGEQFVIGEQGITETNNFEVEKKVGFTVADHESSVTKEKLKVGCTEIDREEFINTVKLALSVGFINFDNIKS